MPRWLASLMIFIGFIALIGLAFVPRQVTVIVDVDAINESAGANRGDALNAAARSPADQISLNEETPRTDEQDQ